MKKLLFILFILIASTAFAQYSNGGENVYHIYNEQEGFPYPINGTEIILNNGAFINLPYGRPPSLIGNNYYKPLTYFHSKQVSAGINDNMFPYKNNWYVLSHNNKFLIYDYYSLTDSFEIDKGYEIIGFSILKKSHIVLARNEQGYKIFVYKNKKVISESLPTISLGDERGLFCINDNTIGFGNLYQYVAIDEDGNISPVFKDEKFKLASHPVNKCKITSDSLLLFTKNGDSRIFQYSNGKISKAGNGTNALGVFSLDNSVALKENGKNNIYQFTTKEHFKTASFEYTDNVNASRAAAQNSYYVCTGSKLLRVFKHLKRYPKIYGNNASLTFALQQAADGKIWAGSYNGGFAIIDTHKTTYYSLNGRRITNGGCMVNDKMYLINENLDGGILQFTNPEDYKNLTTGNIGFINYADTANKIIYFGTHRNSGLWFTHFDSLNNKTIQWNKIDRKNGLNLFNILSITKDKKERIWLGHSSKGWAVYYPKQDKAKTFLIEDNETDFGFMSSLTDTKGTVWLGTKQQGLLYYNNYKTDTVNPKDIQCIEHPLLPKGKTITSMVQHGNWLIMGVTNYDAAFDLAAWHSTGKILVKYLNPQEANFTAETEQNTLLVDKRDSSVWFSTNDMLYQWDFKTWLQLPAYTANPNINISYNATDTSLSANNTFYLKPTQNNIHLQMWFQTRDNMPRYIATAFGNINDSLQFENVTLNTHYNYSNLASGNYVFKLLICQSDGSVSYHHYYITVNKFWWQHWWIWLLFSLAIFTPLLLWLNAKRKTAVQNRQLANLQVVALSNQFKPHFILNALNSVGAAVRNNPSAEIVLSNLGNAINIIFDNSIHNSINHKLISEWQLIENIIEMNKIMYLQQLQFTHTPVNTIACFNSLDIPIGLLQIHIENALLHGLKNKPNSSWELNIDMVEDEKYLTITITDNGIGRRKAATLSNYIKHGLGTKNQYEMIDLLNKNNNQKIIVAVNDDIFKDGKDSYGTQVIITIPKKYNYAL